MSARDILWKRT